MDTVDTQSAADTRPAAYDAFISYSHAADGLLAPRLQSALHRFAKPWWKRRAIRVFRDESSLSANPHLWSSITQALDQSAWFILLLSPEAAQSQWVNQEIDYWRTNKDPTHILPVVTDGDFNWTGTGDAFPPALAGAFTEEPRWVDLRWARSDEHLDLNNARFRNAIADIASTIRAIPKDDLEGEEVRQHRRTIRTAWAAGVALAVLLVAAATFGAVALNESSRARQLAEEETEARSQAETNASEAAQQRDAAQAAGIRATAEALAASSSAVLPKDPDLALLLAIQAVAVSPDSRPLSALHAALQASRTVFQAVPAEFGPAQATVGGLSPDGEAVVVVGFGTWTVDAYDVESGEHTWRYVHDVAGQSVKTATFSADGEYVVLYVDSDPGEESEHFVGFLLLDPATGAIADHISVPRCQFDFPFMGGPYIDLDRPFPTVISGDCDPFSPTSEVGLTDLSTSEFTLLSEVTTSNTGLPTTDESGRLFAAGFRDAGFVRDLTTGETVLEFGGGISTLSADGELLLASAHPGPAASLELWSVGDRQRLWTFPEHFSRAFFSSDGTLVYGATYAGGTYVFDANTGSVLFHLVGQTGRPVELTMSADNSRLATFAVDEARVWDIGSQVATEGPSYATAATTLHHQPNSADVASTSAAVWGWDIESNTWSTSLVDLITGEIRFSVNGGAPSVAPDGESFAFQPMTPTDFVDEVPDALAGLPLTRFDPVEVRSTATGSLRFSAESLCSGLSGPDFDAVFALDVCEPDQPSLIMWDLEFSGDGTRLAAGTRGALSVWSAADGSLVTHIDDDAIAYDVALSPDGQQVAFFRRDGIDLSMRFVDLVSGATLDLPLSVFVAEITYTPDGSRVLVATDRSSVLVVDPEDGRVVADIPAHQGGVVTDVAVSPDGEQFATVGLDSFLRTWNLDEGTLETEIAFGWDSARNVEYVDESTLFVTGRFDPVAITVVLDPADLLDVARRRVFRTFTTIECQTYRIDPCPTLEELRNR